MTDNESSSFNLNCFDDDFDKHVEEINEYYEYLENHDYIELNWKCPGRKSLQKAEDKEPQIYQTPPKESSQKNMEFDFEDEKEGSTVKLNQLRTPKGLVSGPKTVATNKTTFNSVMKKLKKRN